MRLSPHLFRPARHPSSAVNSRSAPKVAGHTAHTVQGTSLDPYVYTNVKKAVVITLKTRSYIYGTIPPTREGSQAQRAFRALPLPARALGLLRWDRRPGRHRLHALALEALSLLGAGGVPAAPAVHLVQVAGDGEVWDGVHAPRVLKALACGAPSRQAADGALGGTLKAGASSTSTWRAHPRGRNRKRLVVPTCSAYLEWVKLAGAR